MGRHVREVTTPLDKATKARNHKFLKSAPTRSFHCFVNHISHFRRVLSSNNTCLLLQRETAAPDLCRLSRGQESPSPSTKTRFPISFVDFAPLLPRLAGNYAAYDPWAFHKPASQDPIQPETSTDDTTPGEDRRDAISGPTPRSSLLHTWLVWFWEIYERLKQAVCRCIELAQEEPDQDSLLTDGDEQERGDAIDAGSQNVAEEVLTRLLTDGDGQEWEDASDASSQTIAERAPSCVETPNSDVHE
ncbi:hypothetical protein LTR66_006897 [Elasticomyces elasticus]|nr:hypothetical protein LTR66_006897 [Elasticomyces elasticus]